MPFKPGNKLKTGRQKGTPNKVNTDIKQAIKDLLERNANQMDKWLDRVAKRSPYKALDLMNKFAEYSLPKLSRVESTNEIIDKRIDLAKLTPDICRAPASGSCSAPRGASTSRSRSRPETSAG